MPDLPPDTRRLPLFTGAARLQAAAIAVAVVLPVVGGWFIARVAEHGRDQVRNDLAELAITAAAALDPQQVSLLTGTAADEGSPALASLRMQLRRIHDAVPAARFVYLSTVRQGRVIFLADAEPLDSPDYSAPGDVYEEAPEAFREVFSRKIPQTYGPFHDRWGDWITGLAPISQHPGGPAIAVLGIDFSAQHYQRVVAGYRRFALAIAALFVAIAVLAAGGVWMMRRFNARLQSDLDQLSRAQQHLQLSAAVIHNMVEGLMITDARLQIESVNPAFERITGYASAEAIGRTPKILFSGRHDDAFFHQLHERADAQGNWRGEIWNRRRSGELYPQRTSISVLRDGAGSISHYTMLFSDNTMQNQMEAKLREMSSVDGLTGIANRRTFDEVLAREWARALRDGRPLSLVMADIDFFKGYNDRHGHLGGDRCLQQVAQGIAAAVNRASDLAARYGGEEFAIILPEADSTAAAVLADKICAGIAALKLPHGDSETAEFVTLSLGVATVIPRPGSSASGLVGAADAALYQAKRSGRNRVVSAMDGEDMSAATT